MIVFSSLDFDISRQTDIQLIRRDKLEEEEEDDGDNVVKRD